MVLTSFYYTSKWPVDAVSTKTNITLEAVTNQYNLVG